MKPLPLLIAALGAGVSAAAFGAPDDLAPGAVFQKEARLKRGEHRLPDPANGALRVTGADFTLDFRGARLVGDGKGVGLHVMDARNVTIKNATLTGYHWGAVLERCQGVKLVNCVVSRNGDLPPGTVIDESGRQPEDQHGGGILLRDSSRCVVERCRAQHQWDGIDVIRSNDNVIQNGDFSYNGNWGVHFWASSRNVFRNNRAVWCTTGSGRLFQALTGWQTYDAQAVALDHASNENLIEGNDLRFGGDGVFIRANEGPQKPGFTVPPLNSSDRNILRNNDCSFSPNNAIEADLIAGTVVEGNNCSFSNYGMWLGYSTGTQVRGNWCLNDSTRAVEIENGQNITFEKNVFAWEPPRPNGTLVLLRHNGRDQAIPSGPYTLNWNYMYGAGTGVSLVRTTKASVSSIVPYDPASRKKGPSGPAVVRDETSGLSEATLVITDRGKPRVDDAPESLRPGQWTALSGRNLSIWETLPVVTLDGIPLWTRRASGKRLEFRMPGDFWDRPAPESATLRVGLGDREWKKTVRIDWPGDLMRITRIEPQSAVSGQTVKVDGVSLLGKAPAKDLRLLLNGQPVPLTVATDRHVEFIAPAGMLVPSRFNLLLERGEGLDAEQTWPIPFFVQLKPEQLPHLTDARFSPTTLKVGDLLKVELTVRNNLPYAAPLQVVPQPPHTYDERASFGEQNIRETRGALHLRVTSDHPGEHESGSWPWLFGFPKAQLTPGETITVTGYVRVRTPGEHEFRVGLVAGGYRFIDDNAFRTKITVLP